MHHIQRNLKIYGTFHVERITSPLKIWLHRLIRVRTHFKVKARYYRMSWESVKNLIISMIYRLFYPIFRSEMDITMYFTLVFGVTLT